MFVHCVVCCLVVWASKNMSVSSCFYCLMVWALKNIVFGKQESVSSQQIALKFSPYPWRISRSSIINSTRESLHRLNREKLALVQHHWSTEITNHFNKKPCGRALTLDTMKDFVWKLPWVIMDHSNCSKYCNKGRNAMCQLLHHKFSINSWYIEIP